MADKDYVKVRIKKINPSGRTHDILSVNGESAYHIQTEEWTKMLKEDFNVLCLNPTLYEWKKIKIVNGVEVEEVEEVVKETKKKK